MKHCLFMILSVLLSIPILAASTHRRRTGTGIQYDLGLQRDQTAGR